MPSVPTGPQADSWPNRRPARPGEPSSSDPPTVEVRPAQGGTEVVLVVDDERGVRTLARHILCSYGYTVMEARGPEEALQAAAAHDGPIHLLLADVSLHRGCGRALAAVLMAVRPDLKVLFMSGLSEAAVGPAASEPARFLSKPFTASELVAKVRQVLDGA